MDNKTEWLDAAGSYNMDGVTYAFNIVASSPEDAERRLQAIKGNGRIDGWPCFGMKANHATLPLVALWLWVKKTLYVWRRK